MPNATYNLPSIVWKCGSKPWIHAISQYFAVSRVWESHSCPVPRLNRPIVSTDELATPSSSHTTTKAPKGGVCCCPAGFSGNNLFLDEHRYFVCASVAVRNDEAVEIVKKMRADSRTQAARIIGHGLPCPHMLRSDGMRHGGLAICASTR